MSETANTAETTIESLEIEGLPLGTAFVVNGVQVHLDDDGVEQRIGDAR